MERLRRKRDMHRVFHHGRRFHSECAVLHARLRGPQEGLPPIPRLAVLVGRGFRTSVARNRARRLLREACRAALRDKEAPWDLILIARAQAAAPPFPSLVQTITDLLHEAGTLAEKAATPI